MTTVEAAPATRRARHFRWLERRLFEILGGWVPTVPEPEAKLVLRVHSFQHAWHADLWRGLLPQAGRDDPFPEPDPAGISGLAGVLDAMAEPRATLDRLTGAYRVVLPRLVAAYSTIREEVSPAAGGPAIRAVGLMLADDLAAQRVGEGLVPRLVGSADEAQKAADHRTRLEEMLLACGGPGRGVMS